MSDPITPEDDGIHKCIVNASDEEIRDILLEMEDSANIPTGVILVRKAESSNEATARELVADIKDATNRVLGKD